MKYYAVRLIAAFSTFIMGITFASVLSPSHHDAVSNGKAEQEVLQVEREYIRANLQGDTATLDHILADDFTINCYGRRVVNKAQRLALLRNPAFGFASMETNDVQVTVSDESATLTGEAVVQGHYQDEEFTSPPYRFARTYEKRQGQWQIVSVRVIR
jgi:ketosteroid isomerase-like protein